jgi:hypothetical protein
MKRFIRSIISKKALADRQAKGNDPEGTTCDRERVRHEQFKVGKIEKRKWGKSDRARVENIRQPDGEAEMICSEERKEAQRPGGISAISNVCWGTILRKLLNSIVSPSRQVLFLK